jgi:ABC-type transport system involved in cytochrome c biogenesis permease subunit
MFLGDKFRGVGMHKQRMKIVFAIVFGVLAGFLLFGLSYVMFPAQASESPIPLPTSKPEAIASQIFWAIQLIGVAVVIASVFAGVLLICIREKDKFRRKSLENAKANPL